MKTISFDCPECMTTLEATEDMCGEDTDCPNCHKPITIPRLKAEGGQRIKDELKIKYGGEWKQIKLPDENYGDGMCALGCGMSIFQGATCYELKSKGKLITLLCQECWSEAE